MGNADRVKRLNDHKTYILDVPSSEIKTAMGKGSFSATTDFSRIKELDAVIICVPYTAL